MAIAGLGLALLLMQAAVPVADGIVMISGGFEAGRQPDGNSVVLDAPRGLIVVDSGRHPAHQRAILDYAASRGRQVNALINTHWHLDHSGGNAELRQAFPQLRTYASGAVVEALGGFLAAGREDGLAFIASGKADAETEAEIRGDVAAVEEKVSLLPTHVVDASGAVDVAGRMLTLNIAPHAATAADIWIVDPSEKLVVAGDLVTLPVPFLDTACPDGWRAALETIAGTEFETLVPGHGPVMTKADFLAWKSAFDGLLDCAASDRSDAQCAAGWAEGVAAFLDGEDRERIDRMIAYYLANRLRPKEKRDEYCAPAAVAP